MEEPRRSPRRIRTLAEAGELVATWKASGQTKGAWCQAQGLLRSTLQSCLQRVEAKDLAPGFIEIRPTSATEEHGSGGTLILELGHGMRLVGLDVAQAIALVRGLQGIMP